MTEPMRHRRLYRHVLAHLERVERTVTTRPTIVTAGRDDGRLALDVVAAYDRHHRPEDTDPGPLVVSLARAVDVVTMLEPHGLDMTDALATTSARRRARWASCVRHGIEPANVEEDLTYVIRVAHGHRVATGADRMFATLTGRRRTADQTYALFDALGVDETTNGPDVSVALAAHWAETGDDTTIGLWGGDDWLLVRRDGLRFTTDPIAKLAGVHEQRPGAYFAVPAPTARYLDERGYVDVCGPVTGPDDPVVTIADRLGIGDTAADAARLLTA